MENIHKTSAFVIFALLIIVGSSFAQDDIKKDKSDKKCNSACCSSKESSAKMDKNNMKHEVMMNVQKMDENKDGKIYQCPMHSNQISDNNGKCEKCGMNLKEISIKDAEQKLVQSESKMMRHDHMDHAKMEKASADEGENNDVAAIDKNNDNKVFQCPMCSDQISDENGKCAKCGMDLKEVSTKDAQKKIKIYKHK